MKGRVLRCPHCGSHDVLLTCRAKVRLEVDEVREDGAFTVNYDEVFGLHGFSFRCHRCPATAFTDSEQGEEPTKATMRKWSEEVED